MREPAAERCAEFGHVEDEGFRVRVQPSGWCFQARPSQTLLQAAQQAGGVMPSSCRNGSCRTCMVRLRAGRVRYRIEWPGLLAEEKAEGWILPCVAEADSDLELDAPAARPPATVQNPSRTGG